MPGGTRTFVVVAAVALGVLSPAAWWVLFENVPQVSVREAIERLREPGTVLLDIRSREASEREPIPGAVLWRAEDDPSRLGRDWKLLVLCESGMRGARFVKRWAGKADVANVRGGARAWKTSCVCSQSATCVTRLMSASTQWVAVIVGFVIKPLYMLLALVLAVLLRRKMSPDLVALRWALWCFLAGEALCAVNYLAFGEESLLLEHLHSYGMVLCLGSMTYAFLEAVDLRLLKYSDPDKTCAALGLCRSCIKLGHPTCRLKQVFLFLIPVQMVLACMAFGADPKAVSYNTEIFGNHYTYGHAVAHQIFEMRVCPMLAVALFGAALLALWAWGSVPWSKVLFAAGMGFFAFGMFRLFLFAAYRHDLFWFVFWEETTELLLVVAVAVLLWLFREGLVERTDPPTG